MLRGLERLLGCLFYQKDCSKAFNKHSTEGKLSNQIHREIKGYVWLNQARRRSLDVSLLGNRNWFLTKVLHGSRHGSWIKFETTENLDRVYLRQIVIHPPLSQCLSTQTHTHTNSYIQAQAFHTICIIYIYRVLKYHIYHVLSLLLKCWQPSIYHSPLLAMLAFCQMSNHSSVWSFTLMYLKCHGWLRWTLHTFVSINSKAASYSSSSVFHWWLLSSISVSVSFYLWILIYRQMTN